MERRTGLTCCSDTLKRHQKLHLADAQKPAKQSSRPLKRRRSDTTIESNQSDQSTESSVDQSPEAETVDPQPIFDSLGGGWDYPSLDPLFSTNSFTFPTTADFNNYFNATNLVAEDEEEKEATKLTVSPDSLWEI